VPHRAAALALGAGDLLSRAADQALQLHGGYGYMREYPIAQAFADSRYFRLVSGTGEIASLAAELGL
jgi:acyl-CoA dehydrogenase